MNIKIKIHNISLFAVLLSTVMLVSGCKSSKQKDATAGGVCDDSGNRVG